MDRLDRLTLFLAIADAGSLVAAARRTGRSPPVVTRVLGELEAELGVRLAERTTRRLALTDAGMRLAEHARRLTADFDGAMHEVAGEGAAPRGRLRISAPLTFGRLHVMPIVTAFLESNPHVTAELSLDDRPVDLIEEGIDVALRIAHLDSGTLVARRVGAVRRIVVASPRYLKQRGRPAAPDELAAHDIVLFVNQANGPDWRFQALDGSEREVRVSARFQVNRAEAAIDAARDGRGIAHVLSYQVADDMARGRLVRLLRPFERPPIPVHIVFPTARLMAPRVRAFLDFAVPRLSCLKVLRSEGT
ncbi:LysR family transcriptional regulator [Vineibacter terrae]|uniref:LysR family transcriptional regulator n=1 Tax=Vineibacter terrae TaxID=2586908 RepID=A0A5C8PTW8_9HYPH|nr:LysR family transcriptional regulator [Vineibacter terrae]TXL80288.1 LysR family transcriptional regulator [Vineibacter terrae]